MDEFDEKIRFVYEDIGKLEVRIIEKIEKSEHRSLESTKDKLLSLEKLVHTSTTARHETIATELSRLQTNNSACTLKCTNTVKWFDERIQNLERFRMGVDIHLTEATGVQNRLEILERSKIGSDNYLDVGPAQIRALTEKVLALENWKAANWQRTIIYAGVAIVAAVKILEWVSKLIPAGG